MRPIRHSVRSAEDTRSGGGEVLDAENDATSRLSAPVSSSPFDHPPGKLRDHRRGSTEHCPHDKCRRAFHLPSMLQTISSVESAGDLSSQTQGSRSGGPASPAKRQCDDDHCHNSSSQPPDLTSHLILRSFCTTPMTTEPMHFALPSPRRVRRHRIVRRAAGQSVVMRA